MTIARISHRSGCARIVRTERHGELHEDAHWLDGTVDLAPCETCTFLAGLPVDAWPREAAERLCAAISAGEQKLFSTSPERGEVGPSLRALGAADGYCRWCGNAVLSGRFCSNVCEAEHMAEMREWQR